MGQDPVPGGDQIGGQDASVGLGDLEDVDPGLGGDPADVVPLLGVQPAHQGRHRGPVAVVVHGVGVVLPDVVAADDLVVGEAAVALGRSSQGRMGIIDPAVDHGHRDPLAPEERPDRLGPHQLQPLAGVQLQAPVLLDSLHQVLGLKLGQPLGGDLQGEEGEVGRTGPEGRLVGAQPGQDPFLGRRQSLAERGGPGRLVAQAEALLAPEALEQDDHAQTLLVLQSLLQAWIDQLVKGLALGPGRSPRPG